MWAALWRCCMDPAGGAAGRAGVAGRPLTCLSDAQRALQAEPGPPSPHSPAEAQANELARVRRRPPPARELDGLVHRGSRPGVASRATDHPGRAARLLAPGDPDSVDLARRLSPAVPVDRRPHRLRHRPAWQPVDKMLPACGQHNTWGLSRVLGLYIMRRRA